MSDTTKIDKATAALATADAGLAEAEVAFARAFLLVPLPPARRHAERMLAVTGRQLAHARIRLDAAEKRLAHLRGEK